MKQNETKRTKWPVLAVGALIALTGFSTVAQSVPTRNAAEDVRSASVRLRAGLAPNGNLLFNGWGVTPAGEQIPISDMALKFVISPDKKMLAGRTADSTTPG